MEVEAGGVEEKEEEEEEKKKEEEKENNSEQPSPGRWGKTTFIDILSFQGSVEENLQKEQMFLPNDSKCRVGRFTLYGKSDMKTDDLGKHGLFVCMSMPVHPRVSPTHRQGGTRHVAAAQHLQQKSQTTSEIIYKWINSGFPYLGKKNGGSKVV